MESPMFTCDPNFCSLCGSILPLPTSENNQIQCRVCSTAIDISSLHGIEIHSFKSYNQHKLRSTEEIERMKEIESVATKHGPVVERECSKCQHKKMTYTTRQTRSADEGQTVFYTCLKCGFTETEYS